MRSLTRPVFIIGTPRSGTTQLFEILSSRGTANKTRKTYAKHIFFIKTGLPLLYIGVPVLVIAAEFNNCCLLHASLQVSNV
jgi:hypothetical protein